VSSRQIKAALKANDIHFEQVFFSWQPTPEENVPMYTVVLNSQFADICGEDHWNNFATTAEAVAWIESIEVQTYSE
jgi:hypothetical protein